MPSAIDEAKKNRIVNLWISGDSRDDIAAVTGVATGTVSNTVHEFRKKIGEPQVDALRQLGSDLNKKGYTFEDILPCIRLFNVFKNNAMNLDDIEDYITTLQRACISKGVSPELLVNYSEQLLHISESEKIDIRIVPNYIKEKLEQKKKIEQEISGFEDERQKLQKEIQNEFQSKNVTMEALRQYEKTDAELKKRNLSMKEIDRFMTALDNVAALGFDPRTVAEKLTTIKSLESKVAELRVNQKNLENNNEKSVRDLQSYRILKAMNVKPEELQVLQNKLKKISEAHCIDTEQAAAWFFSDVLVYDVVYGLEKQILDLSNNVEGKKEEIKHLESKYALKKKAIEALEYLIANGISERDLANLNDILIKHESELGIGDLNSDLKVYAVLRHDIKELSAEREALEAEVELARKKNDAVVMTAIREIKDEAINQMKKVGDSILSAVKGQNIPAKDNEQNSQI